MLYNYGWYENFRVNEDIVKSVSEIFYNIINSRTTNKKSE